MLTERRKQILTAVVDHYVSNAVPVGSKVLAERYVTGASPATIRADLGALEKAQLLFQPHTSAGRLPTERGYRCVVDDFLAHPDVSSSGALYPDVTVSGQLCRPAMSSAVTHSNALMYAAVRNELLQRAALVLASCTNCLAIVALLGAGQLSSAHLYHKGFAELLSQPEFHEPERFLTLMRILDDEGQMLSLVQETLGDGHLSVRIGREFTADGLDEISVVVGSFKVQAPQGNERFFPRDEQQGVAAVIGPVRMPYRRAIRAVATTTHTLSETLRS